MAPGANTLDDFLAQVAALGEAHGVIDADLEQQIVFIEVETITGNTIFDAQYILRLCTDPGGRKLSAALAQGVRYLYDVETRDDEIECWIGAAIFPDDTNGGALNVDHRMLFWASRQRRMAQQFLQNHFGARALKGKKRILGGAIGNFHIVGYEITLQMPEDLGFQIFPEVEIERIHRAKHPDIGDHFALLGQNCCVLAVKRIQAAQIVGEHSL